MIVLTSSSLLAVFTESMLCDKGFEVMGTSCPTGLSILLLLRLLLLLLFGVVVSVLA